MSRSRSNWQAPLAFGTAFAIVLLMVGLAHRSMAASQASDRWVRHTHEVLEDIEGLQFGMEIVSSSIRRFVITGGDAALGSYRDGKKKLARHAARIRSLTQDNPVQQQGLSSLESLAAGRLQRAELIVDLRQTQGIEAAIATVRDGPSFQITAEFQAVARNLENEEIRLLALREAQSKLRASETRIILGLGSFLSLLIIAGAGWSVQRDATRRVLAEDALFEEKERAQITLGCIGDAVVCTDIGGNLTYLNAVAERMTGWPWHEAAGRPMTEVVQILDGESRQTIPNPMQLAIAQNRSMHLPANSVLIRRDGLDIPVEDTVSPIHDRQGRVSGAVMVFRDATAVRAVARQLTHAAAHDFLTGLPNRMLLNDRINQAIALAPRHHKQVAVLFLDLNGFKRVNDTLGHPVGDRLLQSVAGRLVGCVRASDTVSRHGGDEFVVLLSEVQQLADVALTARRILEAVAQPHAIDEHEVRVTTSIGASVFPDDGCDAQALIKNADTAMYQAKTSRCLDVRFFKSAMTPPRADSSAQSGEAAMVRAARTATG